MEGVRGYSLSITALLLAAPAFDSQGRLSGVPTFTVGDSGDKIGYLHPIEMIPAAWLRR